MRFNIHLVPPRFSTRLPPVRVHGSYPVLDARTADDAWVDDVAALLLRLQTNLFYVDEVRAPTLAAFAPTTPLLTIAPRRLPLAALAISRR